MEIIERAKIEVDMGNDAMRTRDDLAGALREIADKIENGDDTFILRDGNGNTVGDVALTIGIEGDGPYCPGHPADEFGPMGMTQFCDGTCN